LLENLLSRQNAVVSWRGFDENFEGLASLIQEIFSKAFAEIHSVLSRNEVFMQAHELA